MIATIVAAAAVGTVAYHAGLVHAAYQIMDADEGERERIWADARAIRDRWREARDKRRTLRSRGAEDLGEEERGTGGLGSTGTGRL